eukprot:5874095-Prymnesium_polylepis.1
MRWPVRAPCLAAGDADVVGGRAGDAHSAAAAARRGRDRARRGPVRDRRVQGAEGAAASLGRA